MTKLTRNILSFSLFVNHFRCYCCRIQSTPVEYVSLSNSDMQLNFAAMRNAKQFVHKFNPSLWALFTADMKIQLCGTELEEFYMGSGTIKGDALSKWTSLLDERIKFSYSTSKDHLSNKFELGNYLGKELNAAITAVSRASRLSSGLQKMYISDSKEIKTDNSPVTIADFSVQALIIDYLSRHFPGDKFIAEENSDVLKLNSNIRNGVLHALTSVTGEEWDQDRLYNTVDKGSYDGTTSANSEERIWVLDPIDGTKGFIRGEHYCVALALMIGGQPKLSVMGCPNLAFKSATSRSLDSPSLQYTDVVRLDPDMEFISTNGQNIGLAPLNKGCVFFALSGHGAFVRSLSMPLGAAYQVQVSDVLEPSEAVLCESMESTHGDRDTTAKVSSNLKMRYGFLRIDGQCKYSLVGAGIADANLRLPKGAYREKIWDHAPGSHFVSEAGGCVTDLNGRALDFSQGRLLSADVTAIVASNGLLHDKILQTLREIRR